MGLSEVILKEVVSGNIETILLLLPLIIIGLGILYITLNYIRKNLGWIKERFKSKKRVVKEGKRINYSQELNKINKSNVDEALGKINSLIDQFFMENFKLEQSYTYQELIKEFEKRKKTDLKEFFDDLLEIQYTKEEVSKKELDRIIRNFSKIIHKYGSRRKRVKQTTVSWMEGFGNKLIERLRYKPKRKEEIIEGEGLFDALKKLKKKYNKVREENIKLKILEKRKEEERKKEGAIAKRRKGEEEKKEEEREKRRKREGLKKEVHEFLFGFIDKYKKRRIEERRLKAIKKAAEEKRKKREAEERRREELAKKRREKIEKREREEEKRRRKVERKGKIKEIEHKLKNIFISSRKKEKEDVLTRISNYLSKIQKRKYEEKKRGDKLKKRRLDISKEVEEKRIKDMERKETDREKEFGKQRGLFDGEISKLRERLNLMKKEGRRLGKVKDIKKEEKILKKKIDLEKFKDLFSIFKLGKNKEIKRIKKLIKKGEKELKVNVYSAKLISFLIIEGYNKLSEKDREEIKDKVDEFNEKLDKKIKYHEVNRIVLQLEFALKNNDKIDAKILYQRIRNGYEELERKEKKDIYNKMTKLLGK